jgi:hypothetical protein
MFVDAQLAPESSAPALDADRGNIFLQTERYEHLCSEQGNTFEFLRASTFADAQR